MTTALTAAEGPVRSEAAPTTWVSQQTILSVLNTYGGRLNRLVAEGKIRRRQIAGMRPQYALEDALALR